MQWKTLSKIVSLSSYSGIEIIRIKNGSRYTYRATVKGNKIRNRTFKSIKSDIDLYVNL